MMTKHKTPWKNLSGIFFSEIPLVEFAMPVNHSIRTSEKARTLNAAVVHGYGTVRVLVRVLVPCVYGTSCRSACLVFLYGVSVSTSTRPSLPVSSYMGPIATISPHASSSYMGYVHVTDGGTRGEQAPSR